MNNYTHYIGIDIGVHTGIAIWEKQEKRLTLNTMKIHQAMDLVKELYAKHSGALLVRFEDARQRKWFGESGREKLQGAGSIKRDASIWHSFLLDLGVDFECVPPRNNVTKLTQAQFAMFVKYKGRSSEHSRDAAMLVYGK